MSFFENIKEFFKLANQTNYNISEVYVANSGAVYSVVIVILVAVLIAYYFIRKAIKTSQALKLVSQVQNSKDIQDYNEKLEKLAQELPKRGIKVAQSMNLQKDDILKYELELLKGLDIDEKISKYEHIASLYKQIATNSKKYALHELTKYYEDKSQELLENDLSQDIKSYMDTLVIDENEVKNVDAIVTYASKASNKKELLNYLIDTLNRFSYSHNLEFFKFIKKLSKENSKEVYENCTNNFEKLLESQQSAISDVILKYMLKHDNKQKVYDYISNIANKTVLKDLYYNMFGKCDDIDLDLAFVSNSTDIGIDFASYIDTKLTDNWKELGFIKHVISSTGVLETIGHVSYRSVLERIEKLENEEETNKAAAKALEVARRAETIALEARSIARQK
ncbi:MAG: hypothetical protein ACQERD_09445 [Campylobacterota bacterium]